MSTATAVATPKPGTLPMTCCICLRCKPDVTFSGAQVKKAAGVRRCIGCANLSEAAARQTNELVRLGAKIDLLIDVAMWASELDEADQPPETTGLIGAAFTFDAEWNALGDDFVALQEKATPDAIAAFQKKFLVIRDERLPQMQTQMAPLLALHARLAPQMNEKAAAEEAAHERHAREQAKDETEDIAASKAEV